MSDDKNLAIPNQEGTIQIPEEFMGGVSYIRYRMDNDRNLLINDVTGEEKQELLVRISGFKLERVWIDEGELKCASRDTKMSKEGVVCACCPNVNNTPFINKDEQLKKYIEACKEAGINEPPEWNPKSRCSLRLQLSWVEEWDKDEEGRLTWMLQPGICYISCGISSILAMTSRGTGYLARLRSKGYGDLMYVVTSIKVGTRQNEKLKRSYSYETFDMFGSYEDVTKKSVNCKEMSQNAEIVKSLYKSGLNKPSEQSAEPVKQVTSSAGAVEGEVVSEQPKPAPKPEKPVTEAPSQAQAPAPASQAQPPANDIAATRLKAKVLFGKLPEEAKGIVLSVIKAEKFENIADNDIAMALETIECAMKEMTDSTPDTSAPQTGAKKNPW